MPKGYFIATITIREREGYDAYQAAVRTALEKYGGRYLVRGGRSEAREGSPRTRAVVMEFPDYATAVACYDSPVTEAVDIANALNAIMAPRRTFEQIRHPTN